MRHKKKNKQLYIILFLIAAFWFYIEDTDRLNTSKIVQSETSASQQSYDINNNQEFIINDGEPYFTQEEKTRTDSFEQYSKLDELGRCGIAYASISKDTMPTEERGSIGHVRPSGWHTIKYDSVDGKYLYNRCHLIAFCLAGENANEKNLITGTRYFNVQGMLQYETQVAEYVDKTGNHVLYRVTPMYEGNNLVAHAVRIEAWSIEDNGEGICFNVIIQNIQPGISIDYKTGESVELSELD